MIDRYAGLEPDFLVRLRGFEGACEAHGLKLRITEGFRDPARSDLLYAQWIASGKTGPRAAPGGKSAHNWGLAADYVCLSPETGDPLASSEDPAYVVMEEIAPRFGLKTLRHLGDGGHVELDGWEFHDVVGGSSTV